MVEDEVIFYGHPNVQSLHARTIEITKDEHLTVRGDCIIGVRASKACADLNNSLRSRLMTNGSIVKIEIMVEDETFVINGRGDEHLSLLNAHDIVARKTGFVCPRTVSNRCDKASCDIPRKMAKMLLDKNTRGVFRITVE